MPKMAAAMLPNTVKGVTAKEDAPLREVVAVLELEGRDELPVPLPEEAGASVALFTAEVLVGATAVPRVQVKYQPATTGPRPLEVT
jgi:hypothetical protein